jgi:hypothetical protein
MMKPGILARRSPFLPMEPSRQQVYLALIEQLLQCPTGEESAVLESHRELLDAGFLAMGEHVAQMLEQQKNQNAAQWLRKLLTQLAEAIAPELAEATADSTTVAPADAADEPAADAGASADIPEGPPMSGGEVEGLRIAINRCWVTSTLSTEAMNTTVTLRVEMSEAGKPTSIEMTSFEGGSEAAAQKAFEAGRRAVNRCAGANGYDLPAEKYGQWNVLNLIFDPNGMRLR